MARIAKKNIGAVFCDPAERHSRDGLGAKLAMLVIPCALLDLPFRRVVCRVALHRDHDAKSSLKRIPPAPVTPGERIDFGVTRPVRDKTDKSIQGGNAALHPFQGG